MSHATIIAAIDTAIENWVGEPVSILESGRQVTYRSLDELIRARQHYSNLLLQQNNSKAFRVSHLKAGDAR